MYVDDGDYKPSTMLGETGMTAGSWIGGILSAVGAHGVVVVGVALAGLSNLVVEDNPQDYIEEHVVEARFVQLGKPPDPKKLPRRQVPIKTTAPKDSIAVSKREDPPKVDKKKEEPPPNAAEDLLTRLGDRAQAFAEIAEEREREGDPNGIEGGSADTTEGNPYIMQLISFIHRGWTIPDTLGDTSKLATITTVEITRDLHVGPHKIVKSSGVPLFDQSVEDRYNQMREQGTTLPEPPPELANKILGSTLKVRFFGRKQ